MQNAIIFLVGLLSIKEPDLMDDELLFIIVKGIHIKILISKTLILMARIIYLKMISKLSMEIRKEANSVLRYFNVVSICQLSFCCRFAGTGTLNQAF